MGYMKNIGHQAFVVIVLVMLPGGPAAALQNAVMLGLFSYVVDYMQLQSAEAASRHSARMPARKVVPVIMHVTKLHTGTHFHRAIPLY